MKNQLSENLYNKWQQKSSVLAILVLDGNDWFDDDPDSLDDEPELFDDEPESFSEDPESFRNSIDSFNGPTNIFKAVDLHFGLFKLLVLQIIAN
jgi:hypothetical protein